MEKGTVPKLCEDDTVGEKENVGRRGDDLGYATMTKLKRRRGEGETWIWHSDIKRLRASGNTNVSGGIVEVQPLILSLFFCISQT